MFTAKNLDTVLQGIHDDDAVVKLFESHPEIFNRFAPRKSGACYLAPKAENPHSANLTHIRLLTTAINRLDQAAILSDKDFPGQRNKLIADARSELSKAFSHNQRLFGLLVTSVLNGKPKKVSELAAKEMHHWGRRYGALLASQNLTLPKLIIFYMAEYICNTAGIASTAQLRDTIFAEVVEFVKKNATHTTLDKDEAKKFIIELRAKYSISGVQLTDEIATKIANVAAIIQKGACHGFSVCYSVMNFEGKLEWWFALLRKLVNWDGSAKALREEIDLPQQEKKQSLGEGINRILNYVESTQGNLGDFDQRAFGENFAQRESFRGGKIEINVGEKALITHNALVFAGCFTQKDLTKLIVDTSGKKNKYICTLGNLSHTCSFRYDPVHNEYVFYNSSAFPNNKTAVNCGEIRCGSKDKLIEKIFAELGKSLSISYQLVSGSKNDNDYATDYSELADASRYANKIASELRTYDEHGLYLSIVKAPDFVKRLTTMCRRATQDEQNKLALGLCNGAVGGYSPLSYLAWYKLNEVVPLFEVFKGNLEDQRILANGFCTKGSGGLTPMHFLAYDNVAIERLFTEVVPKCSIELQRIFIEALSIKNDIGQTVLSLIDINSPARVFAEKSISAIAPGNKEALFKNLDTIVKNHGTDAVVKLFEMGSPFLRDIVAEPERQHSASTSTNTVDAVSCRRSLQLAINRIHLDWMHQIRFWGGTPKESEREEVTLLQASFRAFPALFESFLVSIFNKKLKTINDCRITDHVINEILAWSRENRTLFKNEKLQQFVADLPNNAVDVNKRSAKGIRTD